MADWPALILKEFSNLRTSDVLANFEHLFANRRLEGSNCAVPESGGLADLEDLAMRCLGCVGWS